ncbi:MAG: PAS domain S-box protein, partial [Leptolyngbyaceae bacterium]|nr:PAS domain S-box protein [Leptolyngbyaceae bacterium]
MKSIDQALLASLDLVFALNVDGQFIYISDLTAQLFGGDRPSLTHQPLTRTQLPPAIVDALSTSHQEILGSGRPTAGQIELEVTYSASPKYYDYTFSPVWGRSNQIEATIFIAKDITQRQHAEVALRESEVKYRTLFEAASDIILILDCDDYSILNANWTAARQLGYSRIELMRLSLREIEDAFDSVGQEQLIEKLEIDGSAIYERVYRHKQGTTFPVEINAQLIEYGDQLCIQSFVRDITERKQAESAIREQQRQLASIAANIPGTVYRAEFPTNASPRFVYVSDYERQLSGFSPDEVQADWDGFAETIHPDDRQRFEEDFAIAQEHHEPLNTEYRIVSRSGEVKWVREFAQFIWGEDKPLVMDGVMFDITEQKQAEFALADKQQQLVAIAANFPGALYREVVHPDGTISIPYISGGETPFNGFTPEQIMENPALLPEAVHPADRPYFEEELRRCRRTLDTLDIEYRNIGPDGTVFWLREMAKFSRTESGEVVADGFSLDITDRKEAQIALEKQFEEERILRRITENIHRSLDLNTVLQTTVNLAQNYLNIERVAINRYDADYNSEILNQAVSHERWRIQETTIPRGSCIEDYLTLYQQGHPLVVDNIHESDLSQTFIEFLDQLQVQSNLVIPILIPATTYPATSSSSAQSTKLWGVVIVNQCSRIHRWQTAEIELMQQIAIQLGIAIQQSELYQWLQNELHERIRAEAEVRSLNDELQVVNEELRLINEELEQRVAQRTQALQTTNQELEQEIQERIRTAEALRQSEQRFRDLVETTNDLVWEEDAQYTITYISPQCQDILGYAPEELIGQSALELIATDEQEFLRQDNERTNREARATYEVCVRHKDGHRVILESNQVSLFDENGEFIGCRGIDRDITARKEAEEKLRRYERIVSATTDGISLVDRNYVYQIVNQTYLNRHGQALEDIIGQSVDDLFSQEFCEQRIRPNLDRCFTGDVVQYEAWIDFPIAGRRYVSANYSPYVEIDGSITGAVVSTRDITELKQAELALRESESQLQQIFDNVHDVFFLKDFETGQTIFINSAFDTLFQIPRQEVYERPQWINQVHPDDLDHVLAILQERNTNPAIGAAFGDMEYRIIRPDGSVRWIWNRTFPIRNEAGEVYRFSGINTDITERKEAEQENLLLSERLEFLLASSPAVIYSCEATGAYDATFISKNVAVTLGYSPEDFLQTPSFWANGIHPDDAPRIFAELSPLFEFDMHRHEYRFLHHDGHYVWLRDELKLVRDADGRPLEIVGCMMDITNRKHAEEALQESEAKNRALINALPDLVIRMSRDGIYLDFFSTDAFRVIGTRDLIGKSVTEGSLPSHLIQQRIDAVHRALDTGEIQIYEQDVPIDGDRQIEEVRVVACDDDSALLIVRDITDRKHVEDALRQSERRYATLTEMAPVGIFRFDAEGRCVYLNPRWYELTGLPEGEGEGDGWMQALHPEDRDRLLACTKHAYEQRLPSRNEGRHLQPDGSITWFDCQMAPELDADGTFLGYVGTVSDMTERKQAEESLRISEERLRTLINALPFGVWAYDAGNRVILQNPVDVARFGNVIGRHINDLEDVSGLIDSYWEVKRRCQLEESVSTETTATVQGEERSFLRISSALPDQNGEMGLLGVAIDITQQKQAELALRNSEHRYSTLAESSPVGIFRFNASGQCIYVNSRW